MKLRRGMYATFEKDGQTLTGRVVVARTKDGRARIEVDRNMVRTEQRDAEGKITRAVYESDATAYLVPRKLITKTF